MRKIKITEEQRQYALKEGITLNADVDAAGGDVKKAVDTTKQQAQKSGVDIKKATIQIPPSNEGRIITKKQIIENRLKKLKQNSEYYQVSEFMKRLGKNINEDLTNTQIRNITGIQDDDELNASVEAEQKEEKEGEIWRSIAELAGGNPRMKPFYFPSLEKMLMNKYGFKYINADDNEECHIFRDNNGYYLYIYPDAFYPNQGKMRIYNMHYN